MQSIAHVEELLRASVFAQSDLPGFQISRRLPEGIENIEILLDGAVIFEQSHRQMQFGRGTIFWHLGGEFDIWRSVCDKQYRCAVFTFRVSRRVPPLATIGNWQNPETLGSFVREAIELFRAPNTDRDVLGTWIYSTLLRQFISSPQDIAGNDMPYKLRHALWHIRASFPDQPSLKELAHLAEISRPQLNRLFQQYLHCTPAHYMLQVRLQHAANLLVSGMDIARVADECRFQSLTSFYTAFRNCFRIAPGEYRTLHYSELEMPHDLPFSN